MRNIGSNSSIRYACTTPTEQQQQKRSTKTINTEDMVTLNNQYYFLASKCNKMRRLNAINEYFQYNNNNKIALFIIK